MGIKGERICFITLKVPKEKLQNNPLVQLINPPKKVKRLSKYIIEAVNNELRQKLNMNRRKDTEDVINWFKSIREKVIHIFAILDIKDFYQFANIY